MRSERRVERGNRGWRKKGRDSRAMGKCFGETKLGGRKAGHKGLLKQQTVPLTCALKEMLPPMPGRGARTDESENKRKRRRGRKERSRGEMD